MVPATFSFFIFFFALNRLHSTFGSAIRALAEPAYLDVAPHFPPQLDRRILLRHHRTHHPAPAPCLLTPGMKGIGAATAGFVAVSVALCTNAYILPNSVGDKLFNEQRAAKLQSRDAHSQILPLAERKAGEAIRLSLTYSKREALDTFDKVKNFAKGQKSYVQNKYGSASTLRKRQIAGLIDYGTDR